MVATNVNRQAGLVAVFTAIAWLGMMLHNAVELPNLSLFSPDAGIPTLLFAGLLAAWWRWPHKRLTLALLLGWALVNLVGSILTVLPLRILPFYPEQTVQHYAVHAIYSVAQLPLVILLIRQARRPH